MSIIYGRTIVVGSSGGIDGYSTLPPPVGMVAATGADRAVEISFEPVAAEYEQYLGDPAYIVVLKEGGIPKNPYDGVAIRLDWKGRVIG